MAHILPFYLVCDESGSMEGDPIKEINSSLSDIHHEVRSNPVVAGKTRLCIIGFSGTARIVLPLRDLSAVSSMPLVRRRPTGTKYGKAFKLLFDTITDDVRRLEANGNQVYQPAVFFLSDGKPKDKKWRITYERVADTRWSLHPSIYAFGFGGVDRATLKQVATVRAFIADQEMRPAAALREFAGWLIKAIIDSGTRPAAPNGPIITASDNIPGFTTLQGDQT